MSRGGNYIAFHGHEAKGSVKFSGPERSSGKFPAVQPGWKGLKFNWKQIFID
jgi:hypothetical protein